jgi:pyruvate/2-oxoglutarate dehydrogenase complex dihydrolipoamide acyltransferase (E2) component
MILQTGGTALGEISTRSSPASCGHGHRARRRDDADVLAIGADQADFGCADAVVDARAGIALGRGIVGAAGYGCGPCEVNRARIYPSGPHLSTRAFSGFPEDAAGWTFQMPHRMPYPGHPVLFAGHGRHDMNKGVIIGAIVVLLAAGGYYQFSYKPAQEAAAIQKAAEDKAAADAKAAEDAAKKAEEEAAAAAKAAEEEAAAAAKAAEEEAAKAAEAAAGAVEGAAEDAAAAAGAAAAPSGQMPSPTKAFSTTNSLGGRGRNSRPRAGRSLRESPSHRR